ncbi:MAG: twin-arginine translocation signal domain-containing protein [Granulosicoccus sp.]|nr:twin-arginine translocation signal domain-containing protein [Granulosicoccus sp.]
MTEKQQAKFIDAGRRGFLQGAAVAGGAVASGTALGSETGTEVVEAVQLPTDSKGYELTEHVKKYYSRARF